MSADLATAGAAAAAFVATNLDDVVVLTALFGLARQGGRLRERHVVVGQVLGLGALVLIVLGVSILAGSGSLGSALDAVTG